MGKIFCRFDASFHATMLNYGNVRTTYPINSEQEKNE